MRVVVAGGGAVGRHLASDLVERGHEVSLIEQERDIAIVFQIELRQSTKFMEQFSTTHLATYLQMLRGIIETGQETGEFRKSLNPTLTAKFLFGALDEMATNWVLSHRKQSLTALAEPVLDLFFNGVVHIASDALKP